MKWRTRFRKLSFWNKVGFLGSVASIVSLLLVFLLRHDNQGQAVQRQVGAAERSAIVSDPLTTVQPDSNSKKIESSYVTGDRRSKESLNTSSKHERVRKQDPAVQSQSTLAVFAKDKDTSDEEAEIRRLVRDSQFSETLLIYVYPDKFDRSLLAKYWLPEDRGGQAIAKVENTIRRLINKRWHYSEESSNEQFDIRSIKILPAGDIAEVTTYERWYLPLVDEEGRLVKDRDSVFEWPATYRLMRLNGKWLVSTVVNSIEGAAEG